MNIKMVRTSINIMNLRTGRAIFIGMPKEML